MKGFIIYSDYTTINDDNYIRLFGRLENTHSFVTLNKFKPYLYVRKRDSKKIPPNLKTEDTEFKYFGGEDVVRVFFNNKTNQNNFYKEFHKKIPLYEADIRPQYR